jgi:hypothetical protein
MKSKIFAATVLFIAITVSSFGYSINSNSPAIREVAISGAFQKLMIDKNFEVVLKQSSGTSSVTIVGDEKNVQNVDVNIVNDQLIITSVRKLTGKVIVYVPVKNLSFLKLASGASVSGEGVLKFDNLIVEINTDSYVNLKALGKVILQPADDCEFVYEKYEQAKVVYQEH